MEATGGYETLLVDALQEHDIDIVVANPLQVRNFARGFGILEKNDKIDAAATKCFVKSKPNATVLVKPTTEMLLIVSIEPLGFTRWKSKPSIKRLPWC